MIFSTEKPDLNDSLDDLLNSPMGETRSIPIHAPENFEPRDYTEPCSKCRGTGRFISYSGRTMGKCFACKGIGKFSFKTSPQARAANKERATERKARSAEQAFADFKAEHAAVAEWIEQSTDFGFAVFMREAIEKFGSLTEGQMAACERCVAKRAAARQEREDRISSAPTVSISKIEDAFNAARANGLKRLKLRLAGFEFSPAKETSTNAGAIYVKGAGEYLGKVAGGKFISTRACSTEQQQAVVKAVADPKAAAVAYGKRTGTCSCCGRELTDPISIEQGIGPICASKWESLSHEADLPDDRPRIPPHEDHGAP